MSSTISAPGVANTADRDRSGAWAAFQAKLGELLDTYRRAGRDLESQARREALRHELADLRARLAAGGMAIPAVRTDIGSAPTVDRRRLRGAEMR